MGKYDRLLEIFDEMKMPKYPEIPSGKWVETNPEKVLRKQDYQTAFGIIREELTNILDWGEKALIIDKYVMDKLSDMGEIVSVEHPELSGLIERLGNDMRKIQKGKYSQLPDLILQLHEYSTKIKESLINELREGIEYPLIPSTTWMGEDLNRILNGKYESTRMMADNYSVAINIVRQEIDKVLDLGEKVFIINKNKSNYDFSEMLLKLHNCGNEIKQVLVGKPISNQVEKIREEFEEAIS